LLFCISKISLENTKLAVCMCIYKPHVPAASGLIRVIYIFIYYIERESARECAHTGTEGVTLCCGGICVCIYIYICIDIERERERESARAQAQRAADSAAGTCGALIEP
jgi:hypothetical protein